MNQLLLSTAALSLLAAAASAQINYQFHFDANSTGWTGNFTRYTTANTQCGGVGASMRRNLYSGATTGALISPLVGTSLGATTTIEYTYKVNVWSANTTAAGTPWGSFDVQIGSTATGPWTTIATVANEAQLNNVCQLRSHTFLAPAGAMYVRWNCAWGGGDNYWVFDNVDIFESSPCSGTPSPGDVTGAPAVACSGVNYTLGLQNATSGTGVTYQWWSSPDGSSWVPLGTAATQVVSQSSTMYYSCDVTCTASGMTGTSNTLQLDMGAATNPHDFEAGFIGCWSNTGGTVSPGLHPVSAFGVGAQAVRFSNWTWGAASTARLTSPILPATVAGDHAFFDVAGTNYPPNLAWWDTIALQESNDGGVTWSTVVTMDNQPGGLLYTAAYAGQFTPTASQWQNRSFALTPGTNRIRFLGTSGFGNDCFIDNVVVAPWGMARHYPYGASCVPAYEVSANPAPIRGTTVTYTANGIPLWATPNVHASVLAIGFGQDASGTPMAVMTAGALDSPCLVHLTLAGFADVIGLYGNASTDTWNFAIPPLAPLGAELFVQGVAQVDSTLANPSGLVTSNAVRSYVSNGLGLPVGGLDIEWDPEAQNFVPCPNGERRYTVFAWQRKDAPYGVQMVKVILKATGAVITDEDLIPGCLVGKLFTPVVTVCLPVNPTLKRVWRNCGAPENSQDIPGAALAIPMASPLPLLVNNVPNSGTLVAPAGNWLGATQGEGWSSSHPSVLSITPAGNWTATGTGVTRITFRGRLVTDNGVVEVTTSMMVRVQ